MLHLQGLIDRYKDHLPRYSGSVMGYLAWGGKQYYAINSEEPLSLNSSYGVEFITKDGLVEEFTINEDVPSILYYLDEAHTQQADWDTWYDKFGQNDDNNERYTKYTVDNPERVSHKYRYTLEQLYPHPWFPEKEIEAFEVIHIMPYAVVGQTYPIHGENSRLGKYALIGLNTYYLDELLNYPEFFKPIYK
jgi:hypothetical protein